MITTVQAPDGGYIKVEHPEGASEEDIFAYAQANYKPTPIKVGHEGLTKAAEEAGQSLNLIGKLTAGIGSAGYNLATGIGQLAGLARPSAQDLNAVAGTVRGAGPIAQGADIATGIAMTAPLALGSVPASLAGRVAQGAALGGATAGLQAVPHENFLTEKAKQVGLGTAFGGAVPLAASGLARFINPNAVSRTQALRAEGITPTPGQTLGGAFSRAEQGLTSVPILGDAIKAGQRRAAQELNTAAINRSLEPIGQSLPGGVTGRKAIDYAGAKLSEAYDDVLPRLTTQADQTFVQDVTQLASMVKSGAIPEAEVRQFEAILKNQIIGKFQGQASVDGETLKGIHGELGRLARNYSSDPSFDKRQLGQAISQLDDNLRALTVRTNPADAQQLQAINTGWANFKRVQRAASSLGANDGIFSPEQLQSAVRALDRSKDKGAFAKGTALMQDLSEPAKSVLGATVPDSGTPFRALMATGPLGVGAGLLSSPAALLYTPWGQRAASGLLGARPAGAEEAAALVRRAGLLAPLAAPAFTQELLQNR